MRRLRRSVKRRILSVVLLLLLTAGVGVISGLFTAHRTERKYQKIVRKNNKRLEAAERVVYITTKEIKKGEKLTEENCIQTCLLTEQAADSLIKERDGMWACTYIRPGVIINTSLCSTKEFTDTDRECILKNIVYAEWFEDGMTVDVRIRYPNGETYCVLHRKVIRKTVDEKQEFSVFLSEREQLLFSSAQCDTDQYEGAVLYAVGFLEERLQGNTQNEYIPSFQVFSELQKLKEEDDSSAEWHRLREGLEERLKRFLEDSENGMGL